MSDKSKLPKWLNRLNNFGNKYMQPSSESAGENILNKTIEKANSAKTDKERKQIYTDSAKKNLVTTGVSLAALGIPDWLWAVGTNSGRKILGKAAIDMAASIAGGEVVNKIGENISGQPTTGRFVMSQILGDKGEKLYDNNQLISTTSDIISNPGYGVGTWAAKGLTNTVADIIDTISGKIKINKTLKNAIKSGKLKFGNPTTYIGWHQSNSPIETFEFPFNRWDVINHGADPNGAFFTLNGKAEKGFLSKRPWTSSWQITSQRPLIQTGEILGPSGTKNNMRNAIIKYGRKHGADAVEFRGIADNQLQNQNILFATEKTGLNKIGQWLYSKPNRYISPKTKLISLGYEDPIASAYNDYTRVPDVDYDPVIFNSQFFKNLSSKVQDKVFGAIGKRLHVNPENVTLNIKDQPYVKEMEKTVQSSISKAQQGKFPLGVIQLEDGSYAQLRGDLEELGRTYFALQNGIINPNYPIIRGHDLSLPFGVNPNAPIFYGAKGLDQGSVAPYFWSRKIGGKGKLGDIFLSEIDNANYYKDVANEISSTGHKLQRAIESAIKEGDYERAADLYLQLRGLPEFEQPWLLDRMRHVLPYDKNFAETNLKYVPKERQTEIKRMFRQAIEPGTLKLKRPTLRYTIDSSGRLNFNDPRMRIFSGDPDIMEGGAGGYYLREDIPIAEPDITMTKWTYDKPTGVKLLQDQLIPIRDELLGLDSISTDQIGKLYAKKGFGAVAFPVADFHHPGLSDFIASKKFIPPTLIMSPGNSLYDNLYRIDRWTRGLKKGGKINRFKINIKPKNPEQ